ncbi:phosphatidylserine decarboxylase [Fulvivirga sedimenti]|uniref:Phosphatidylserine decarboxylase n=1 Tax=Fulvivirga sedimenti TaxID=2879465 RepID=A0A9X1KXI6_9BACT|nr:phosphatidylserine decarboxylase [Fulvivirga sedimenti]MCA6075049.1 phosphatidylserine decarboxylase [Fulvivirga sedimenti]MCA6076226.1 phosphatidylserine decarboxylase [Fulvivirga sedimenti]MCA6077354.1 phosphatidylserine decarboxylase [Fulvivirga sedimenti]
MNQRYSLSPLNVIILSLILISGCNSTEKKIEYAPATKELISLVESSPELKSMLISSLEQARKINPDPNTNPAQSLEEYYSFVSHCETAMPWALMEKEEYPEIFDHIFQSLTCFYFLIDQPLPELEGKDLVNNSLQYAEPFASWLITFSKSWGSYLDTEDSWNEEYYQAALNDPNFGLQNGWYEDPSNWKTFNEFFARYLKSPEMRPIASPDNNSVVASFADSEPQGVWAIDSNSLLIADDVVVKSASLRSISNLIGDDSEYKDAFANGTFTHSFLNVNDYHRYHFPMSGTVKEVRIIQGINPTGGELWWDAENGRYAFDPSAKTGWQTIETRGCVILETEEYGLVALMPIGMVAVGSVNFENNLKPGVQVKKGDMLGNFAFGGSDFIMIFQDGVNFSIDSPRNSDGSAYEHILMGERLGTVSLN